MHAAPQEIGRSVGSYPFSRASLARALQHVPQVCVRYSYSDSIQKVLRIHLGRISRMGAQYLVNLGNSRTLTRLHLDMFDNDVTSSELNETFAVLGGLNHLDFGFSCHR
jgi:hypothetical protein